MGQQSDHVIVDVDSLASKLIKDLPPPHLHPLSHTPDEREPMYGFQRSPNLIFRSSVAPKLVSIGPYHHGLQSLQMMERVKRRYMADLIRRRWANDGDRTSCQLREYLKLVTEKVQDFRRQYAEPIGMNDEEFVEMLVVDGCFILECLLRFYFEECSYSTHHHQEVRANMDQIPADLLMAGNQIPFSVIKILFKASELWRLNSKKTATIKFSTEAWQIALVYLSMGKTDVEEIARYVDNTFWAFEPLHLLHLAYTLVDPHLDDYLQQRFLRFLVSPTQMVNFFLHAPLDSIHNLAVRILVFPILLLLSPVLLYMCIGFLKRRKCGRRLVEPRIPGATYLRDMGFIFQKRESASGFLNITQSGSTIKIPELFIDEMTFNLFRSLLALERSLPVCNEQYFTTYIKFMSYLIATEEDVSVLRESGIITCSKEQISSAAIVDFFKTESRGVHLAEGHYLSELYITNYYRRHRFLSKFYYWRSKPIPDSYTNPWAIPSMIAAICLLVLTTVQTLYTVFSYYRPHN